MLYILVDDDVYAVALLDTSAITTDENAAEEPDESNLLPIPLRSIRAVASHIPAIDVARAKITEEMESMVLTGLATLVCAQFVFSASNSHSYNSPEPFSTGIFFADSSQSKCVADARSITRRRSYRCSRTAYSCCFRR